MMNVNEAHSGSRFTTHVNQTIVPYALTYTVMCVNYFSVKLEEKEELGERPGLPTGWLSHVPAHWTQNFSSYIYK